VVTANPDAVPVKRGGNGGKKSKAKGEGVVGDERPKPREKGDLGEAKKEKKLLTWNIDEAHMAFLKAMAEKHEIKGLDQVMRKLMKFAGEDEDNECFATAPERPAKFFRLKFTPSAVEQALLDKAGKDFKYDNRHLAVQALVQYVMPVADCDPAEKSANEQMLAEIFAK